MTLMYNDVGIGYYVFRSDDPDVHDGLRPDVRGPRQHAVHPQRLEEPRRHRGQPNVVNLTYGLNFQFRRTAILTAALITPVSSPKPFDVEAALLLNVYLRRTRASALRSRRRRHCDGRYDDVSARCNFNLARPG